MTSLPKLHALAATARLANIPSVASNVFLGIALSLIMATDKTKVTIFPVMMLMLSGICLYCAGTFLNDWADRRHDEIHRPERALPQRLFSPLLYLFISITCASSGLLMAFWIHPLCIWAAAGILAMILLYTALHKRTPWAAIPMGICRALLPVSGFLAFSPRFSFALLLPVSGALLCYVAGISLNARYESMDAAPQLASGVAKSLFIIALLLMAFENQQLHQSALFIILGTIPCFLWILLCFTRYRRPISAQVSALLAGIPLLDWVLLLPAALVCFSASFSLPAVCMFIFPPLAFLSGKWLQKLAPAT